MATATRPAPSTRGSSSRRSNPNKQRDPRDCPDFTRDEVKSLQPLRDRCRDLLGSETESGTDIMHRKAKAYLPMWPGEDDDTYKVRSTLTELYGGYERCVVASRGLVFAKPPALSENADPIVKEHWENIDGMQTHARVFLKDVFTDGFDGLVGIRVDFPKVALEPGKRLSLDELQRAKLRPRWIKVCAEQIVNWRVSVIDGEPTFTLMVIREEAESDDGQFGLACEEQYRVYRLGMVADTSTSGLRRQITYQIWRKRQVDDVIQWYVFEEGEVKGPRRIPVAIGYMSPASSPLVAKPPLASLGDLNLGHYRVSADRRWLSSICHAPTFVIQKYTKPKNPDGTDAPEAPITLGPSAALKLTGEAEAKWVQADPAALDSSKEEKDDLISQIAAMSIAFLSQERRAQETATAHRINALSQNASLAVMAEGLRDLIDYALIIHCEFMGIAKAPTASVNTEYDEGVLDAQTILALNQLEKDANISKGTLLLILQRGKTIPEDVDLVKEERLLLAQAAADAAIAADMANLTADNGTTPPEPPAGKKGKAKKKKPGQAVPASDVSPEDLAA